MGSAQTRARREAARLLKTKWELGRDEGFPVDPFVIADRLGIKVLVTPMRSDVAGALRLTKSEDPVIYLNDRDPVARQRFSCAHEIGHYMNALTNGLVDVDQVEYRAELATRGTDVDEIFANEFGASLLMPAEEVKKLARMGLSTDVMAAHFKVSSTAMGNRRANVGAP